MNILLSGASSQIGRVLLPLIVQQGHACLALSRDEYNSTQDVYWIRGDLNTDLSSIWQGCEANVWVHLAFLPLSLPHLEVAAKAGIKRFIGFSSTSVFTKKESGSSKERRLIQKLIEAEERMKDVCQANDIGWTLFRPTMIYGCGMDQNISFIRQTIDRFGVFPVAGAGKGLRQPVHAEDLALACMAVLHSERPVNREYNLSGAEVLTYREMVERIFQAINRKPGIIHIPPAVYKLAIAVLKQISPRYAFIQSSMVDRMNMDMVFDHSNAANDFGYNPRRFQP